ncbi:MAG: xanthine dehydrogenase family protein subunit M [Thermoplasmatales archaeon]
MPSFEYKQFHDIAQTLKFLDEHAEGTKIIAGGTDLMVQWKAGKVNPKYVVDISEINELNYIEEKAGYVEIGGATKIESLRRSNIIKYYFDSLYESLRNFATWQVRNMATLGGNLCNASPAADLAPPLMVLNAIGTLKSFKNERTVDLNSFFVGPGKTVLNGNELLTSVRIPVTDRISYQKFIKLGNRGSHILSVVNIATNIILRDNTINKAAIALGAVAPTPIRARKTEEFLTNKKPSEGLIEGASELAVKEANPISDIRASKEYRTSMIKVLTKRALVGMIKN